MAEGWVVKRMTDGYLMIHHIVKTPEKAEEKRREIASIHLAIEQYHDFEILPVLITEKKPWTSEVPTGEGWYWYRNTIAEGQGGGTPIHPLNPGGIPGALYFMRPLYFYQGDKGAWVRDGLRSYEWKPKEGDEYYGPIEPPE